MKRFKQRSVAELLKKTQKINRPRSSTILEGIDRIQGPLDESVAQSDHTTLQICRNCRSYLDASILQNCSTCKLGYHEFCLEDSSTGAKCCYDCQQQAARLSSSQDSGTAGVEVPVRKLEEQINKCRSVGAVQVLDVIGTSNGHSGDIAGTIQKDASPHKLIADSDYIVSGVPCKPSKALVAQKLGICRRNIFEVAGQDGSSGVDTPKLNYGKSCMVSEYAASCDSLKHKADQEKLTEDMDQPHKDDSLVRSKKSETLVDCMTTDEIAETVGTGNVKNVSRKQSDGVECADGTDDPHQLHKAGSEIAILAQTEMKDAFCGDFGDLVTQVKEAKPQIEVLSTGHQMPDAVRDATDNIPMAASAVVIDDSVAIPSLGLVKRPRLESLEEKQVVSKEVTLEQCNNADTAEEQKEKESDSSDDDIKVCDICGDVGYEYMLAICSDCGGAEHVYCYQSLTEQVPEGYWQCDICRAKQRVSGVRHATDVKVTSAVTARLPSFSNTKKVNNVGNARSRLSALLQKRRLPPERKRALKGVPPPLSAKRRAVDDVIEVSASKKQTLEISNPTVVSSPKISLLRESSFKIPETGKVKFVSYSTLTGAGTDASGGGKVSLSTGHPNSPLVPITVQSGKARVLTTSNSIGSGTARVHGNAQTSTSVLMPSFGLKPNLVKMNNDAPPSLLYPSKSFIYRSQANLKSSKAALDSVATEGLVPKDSSPGRSSRPFVKANSFKHYKASAEWKLKHDGNPDIPKLKSVNSDLGLAKLVENKLEQAESTANIVGKIKPSVVVEVVSSSRDGETDKSVNNTAKQEATNNIQNKNLHLRVDAINLGNGKSDSVASKCGSEVNDGLKQLEECDERGSIQMSSLSRMATKVPEKPAVDTIMLNTNADVGQLISPTGNTDNCLKESHDITMEMRVADVDVQEESKADLTTLASLDISTAHSETRNSLVSRTLALGDQVSPSVMPSLGCTRCYKCKEIGHAAKFCNNQNSASATDDVNASKSIVSTSESDSTSLPLAMQTNLTVLSIAEDLDSKKPDHGTMAPPLSNNLHAFDGSQCAVSLINSGGQVVSILPPELQASPIPTTGTNNSACSLPVAFNNIVVKGSNTFSLRYQESLKVQPEAQIIWQGTFDVSGRATARVSYEGLQANLSNRALHKVKEAAKKLPASLSLEELPRGGDHNSWPIQFQKSPPINDNIALYFFADGKESYVQHYKPLVDRMIKFDLVLKGLLEDAEILIFPSNLFPCGSQCWQNFMFLWAVFRDRKIRIKQPDACKVNATPTLDVTIIAQNQSQNTASPSMTNGGVCLDVSQPLVPKSNAPIKIGEEDVKGTEVMASTIVREVDVLVNADGVKPSQSPCSQEALPKAEHGNGEKLFQSVSQSTAPSQSAPALISSMSQMNEQSESVPHKLDRSSTLSPTRNSNRRARERVNDKAHELDRTESWRGVSRDREKDRIKEKEKQRDKDRERERSKRQIEFGKERDRYKERDRERERVRDRDRERERDRERWRDREDRERRMRDLNRDRDKMDKERAKERTRDRDLEKDRTSGRDRISRYRHRDPVELEHGRGARHWHRHACSRSRSRSRTPPSNRDWSPSHLPAERYHGRYHRSFRYSRSYSQSPDSDNGFRSMQARTESRELSKDSFARKGKSADVGDSRTRREATDRRMDRNDSTVDDQGNFSQRGSNSDSLCRENTVASKERKLPVTDLNCSPELDDNEEDDMVTSQEVVMPFYNQEEKRSYKDFFPENIVGRSTAETGECSNSAGGIFSQMNGAFDFMVIYERNDCVSRNAVDDSMKHAANPFDILSEPSSCLQFFPTSVDDKSNAPDLDLELRVKTVDCPYRQTGTPSSIQLLDSKSSSCLPSDVFSVSETADLSLSLAVPQNPRRPTVNTSLRLFG